MSQNILCAGVMLAGLSGALRAVPADQKKPTNTSTQTAPPAKAAPAPAKPAQPAVRPAAPGGRAPAPGGGAPAGAGRSLGAPATGGRAPVSGTRTPAPGGGSPGGHVGPAVYHPQPGEVATPRPGGGQVIHDPRTNRTVTTNPRGEVTRIDGRRGLAGTIAVNRGPRGERMVVTGRPGARVVSYGPHRGFVERQVRPGYISRTYVGGGRSYPRVYREFRYHNVLYYRYVPAVYYGPGFYAWAVTPWGPSVRYAWFGLATPAPWFGFYAGYFTPYPTYASPDLWLTDYLLAENLRLAYESQQAGNGGQALPPPNVQPGPATLSPEMKALIADEVRQQLAAEKAAAVQPTSSSPQQPAPGADQPPPALNQRFFVVSSNLDITTGAGQACSLSPGDIIQRKGKDVTPDGGVAVEVVSSKPGDCAADSPATVQLADLQDMHNQFREQLDSGLKTLAENQAKGLPNGPAAGARPVAEGTADPVADAESQLIAQETDAAKLEAQVRQAGGSN